MFKQIKLLFLYTETPLHVGSGSSLGTVDLPIQRERHTNLPMVQASGIKGKLRSAFSQNFNNANADESAKHKRNELVKVIFGPEGNGSSEHAGALSPGDGRILLFPVRSLAGVFAWITCPLVINRLIRDLNLANHSHNWNIESSDGEALVPSGSKLVVSDAVVLEEFSFTAVKNHKQVQNLANWLADNALPAGDEYKFWRDKLKQDLVVISNDAFTDFCKFSTDVVSRTKLDAVKKTVDKESGALWTEENLPADSLLYTPLFASDPRIGNKENILTEVENAAAILNTVQTYLTSNHSRLQLGGNETVGRGIVATRVL